MIQPAHRYQSILKNCRPFVVAHKTSLPHINLTPMGIPIPREFIFDPTTLRSHGLIDGLHALDGITFGAEAMRMPRWVLFDCGEMPGIVFGFLHAFQDLPEAARHIYEVPHKKLVPISMWVAVPCAEPGTWFGHNLSSINVALSDGKISGLAMLTKVMGISVTGAKKQQGATQWRSRSITLHASIGEMLLLSAWTPAHTYADTLSYSIDVNHDRIFMCLREGFHLSDVQYNRKIDPNDKNALQDLQDELEAGARIHLTGAERNSKGEIHRLLLRS